MPSYEMTLCLLECDQDSCQVRAWVDTDLKGTLDTETELPLVYQRGLGWTATFTVCGDLPVSFMYRVGVFAPAGSVWSLSVRRRGPAAAQIFYDSDELAMAKEWLIGTCEDAEAPRKAAPSPRRAFNASVTQLSALRPPPSL